MIFFNFYLIIILGFITNACSEGYKEEFSDYSLVLKEVTAVNSPTSDNTPDYTFSSTEAGSLSYGGSCSSNTSYAKVGNNTITLNTLSDGTYSNCIISVSNVISNSRDNITSSLSISSFTISTSDNIAPANSSISINYGADNTSSNNITLSLTATDNVGITDYYVSENSTTPTSSSLGWIRISSVTSFSDNVSFTLSSSTNAIKTVYIWFKDSSGNISSPSNDSIMAIYNYWKLIAKQADVSAALFSTGSRTTFLENENDNTSSTYMIIGSMTAGDYADASGFYKFFLVWDGYEVETDLSAKEVTWKQTSWLTNSTIFGFEEIGTSGFNDGTPGRAFIGLGDSSSSKCVIDGDAASHNYWFNCVGAVARWGSSPQGIPGPLYKKARSVYLYIWSPYNL